MKVDHAIGDSYPAKHWRESIKDSAVRGAMISNSNELLKLSRDLVSLASVHLSLRSFFSERAFVVVITIGTYLETLETASRNYLDPRNPAAKESGPLVSIWLAIDHNEGSTLC
jgi:hypothetical protein